MPRGRTNYNKASREGTKVPKIMRVREKENPVRIRAGAGINFSHVNWQYLGKGTFEIDEIEKGPGSKAGWGHLANGAGWVALDFVEILEETSK